ncbi:MAG TPA: mandelate racemase/muconate lactonizing enzyme family protein [Verrucomicrobiae bacterium]|nr:mandelate racemase/muconate lactonizing enzyme family protein [Verrucomicrobiae bacterium]
MSKSTDIRVRSARLYFLPVKTRMPLKFGPEVTTSVTCARVCVTVEDKQGRQAEGWGETPLSVQWVWPSALSYEVRHDAMKRFCTKLVNAWLEFDTAGHPMELGSDFQEQVLPSLLGVFNKEQTHISEPMPWLAALVCCSLFDVAIHDAFGQLLQRPTYSTYTGEFMNRDLSAFLGSTTFNGKYPCDFLIAQPPTRLKAWHLIGGLDPLESSDLAGNEPKDGYPVLLPDWIKRDGLKCLKIKLRGNDAAWDHERMLRVGRIAIAHDVDWLTADFNCTVTDPAYVNELLDRLRDEHPPVYAMLLYVEQPFPYDLERFRIDVHSVSARKPLFLDESAHDWKFVRLGRELGWTGVALKTCKTQTGALLSACWAKANGMTLMVQDLTNPMLAQIPHVLLAAHTGTIMGVETNAMQFYPDASAAEAKVHPGLYRRKDGCVDLSSIRGPGFGYRISEIERKLPPPQV